MSEHFATPFLGSGLSLKIPRHSPDSERSQFGHSQSCKGGFRTHLPSGGQHGDSRRRSHQVQHLEALQAARFGTESVSYRMKFEVGIWVLLE